MSTIVLIIIRGKTITTLSHHYRIIEQLLRHNPCDIRALKRADTRTTLDAGYILIDCNAQLVINAQIAIQPPKIPDYSILNAL